MGFMDSLKSMVGAGAPGVEVKLLKEKASVQEPVKGIAVLTGGEYPVTIDKVILQMLMVEEIPGKDKPKETLVKVGTMTMNDFILDPKEKVSLPFQVKIPKDNLISSNSIKHYVQVTLDVSGQDPFGVCEIQVI